MSMLGLFKAIRKSKESRRLFSKQLTQHKKDILEGTRAASALDGVGRETRRQVGRRLDDFAEANRFGAAGVGGQLARAVGFAGLGMGVSSGISSFREKFGDQMSGGANFTLGAIGVAAGFTGGMAGITHLGRAGILAHARYSSKAGQTFTKHQSALAQAEARAEQSLSTMQKIPGAIKTQKAAAKKSADEFGRTAGKAMGEARRRSGRFNPMFERPRRSIEQAPVRKDDFGRTVGNNVGVGLRRMEERARASSQKSLRGGLVGEAGKISKVRRHSTQVSNRAKDATETLRNSVKGHKKTSKFLTDARGDLDRLDALNRANKFSSGRMALGLAKMPFAMGGAMLGKGSGLFGGAVEPGMQFVGKAMGVGTISGLTAGTAVGISAVSKGNLRRTEGPRQKQQGRSFSNISYNATLHSHRLNN